MKPKLLVIAIVAAAIALGYLAREPECKPPASTIQRLPQPPLVHVVEEEAKVVYVTEKEAKASGKPIVYIVTNSKNCAPCRVLKGYLDTPMVASALEPFAVVQILDQSPGHPWMRHYKVSTVPTLVFVAPTGKSMTMPGLPPGVPAFLHGLKDMEAWCAGKLKAEPEKFRKVAESDVAHTEPTLAPHDTAAPSLLKGRSSGRQGRVRDYSRTVDGPTRSIVVRGHRGWL